ncbi:helix-turn-helix transcriptional regulator [Telluribacter humicola]|uniref:helix-turn-helix transcriptional regulator n=1 Tax=Telluribacter humicola TaxID=1720261 RepID=UPI001A95E979|nr:AraC family transcriptional regulator [Telluribacter humicola]
MDIFSLPYAFNHHPNRLVAGSGVEVILYQTDKETEKASVQFEQNAIVILLNGYKEVFTPAHKFCLHSGEGFFIKKGNYLMTEKPFVDKEYQSLLIFFDDKVAQEFATELLGEERLTEKSPSELIHIPASEHTVSFANSLKAYLGSRQPAGNLDLLLSIKVKELFWLLAHSDSRDSFMGYLAHLHNRQVSSLEQLVEQHYRENISLEQLAFLGGLSLSTFKRRFEQTYQTSPRRWIQERRLRDAYFLLKSTEKNVSEVCFEVGFENVSHFVQAFKEKYGHTPKQLKLTGAGTELASGL